MSQLCRCVAGAGNGRDRSVAGVKAAETALEQGKGIQSLENLRAATRAVVSATQVSAE
jgi:hypothetical protein